jgi:ferredoxin
MIEKECSTIELKIYIAGPIEVGKQLMREYCTGVGFCVTVTPALYVYSYGEEVGYIVGLINYPRFPSTEERLMEQAKEIANLLMNETFQGSYTIVAPSKTLFVSRRPQDMLK